MKGGECRIFDRPKYEVKGSKQYDQNWIDGNIEAGVGGCNWTRPEPRPPNIDAGAKVVEAAPVAPRRSGIWQRTKARVKRLVPHHSAPAVATPVAAAPDPLSAPISGTPATFDPPVTPALEPKPPRKPIDELLKPSR